jgi:serine/threonine protein kinase
LDIQRNGLKYRIGTRGFLAPESIFNANIQGKAVDIWAAGVIFLSFLIKRMPVFNMNKFVKIKDETIKELIPLIIVYGRNKIMEIAENFQSSLYVPDIFDRFTLANDYESMIERNDVDKVK